MRNTRGIVHALVIMGLAQMPTVLSAQPVPRNFRVGMGTGFGYAGVVPDAELGAGVLHFLGSSRIAIFADAEVYPGAARGPCQLLPSCNRGMRCRLGHSERNDFFIREKSEWRALNVGVAYGLTPELALLLGAGAARGARVPRIFR